MQNWISILLIVLVVYALGSVLLYFLQDYFLFKPEKLSKDFQFFYDNQVIEEYNIETRDGGNHQRITFQNRKPKRSSFLS